MIDSAIAEMVINREFENPTALWDFVYDSQRGRGINSGYWMDALAAIDIAVWDALGKRNHLPVAALLDSKPEPTFPSTSPVSDEPPRRALTQAKSLSDQGIRGAKIFQSGDIKAALQELDALIHGAPNVQQWMVDTLWMCTLDDAVTAQTRVRTSQPPFLRVPFTTRRPRRTPNPSPIRRLAHRNRRTLPHNLPTQRLVNPRTRFSTSTNPTSAAPASATSSDNATSHTLPTSYDSTHGQRRLRLSSRNPPVRRRIIPRTPPRVPRRPLEPPTRSI